ncbi:unnamed protein product [Bursaphelenchus okinawaensis]|uniref:Uncharacterized protein n=1 Tax=Bursaphelenchus okinawaensis TaxID=465554 RepID=A0A811LPL5_9BILA|nr:unnamed protein product [Bursaphelenchus okinawaensis]CAG9126500.1 unnamed protein product [Bursaphelenchus okinawaensis]
MLVRLVPLLLLVVSRCSSSELRNEIRQWAEDFFLDCIFCMDYDDYKRMSIFGCTLKSTPTCKGNVCYMRQHKQGNYFLYTSGCLNLTQAQYDNIHGLIHLPNVAPDRESTNATQLCEVTNTINTCLCTNKFSCNNVSSVEPFTEYTIPIFTDVNFDEVAHFRYFLPDDPILESIQRTGPRDEYFLIKSVNHVSGTRVQTASGLLTLILLLMINVYIL